MPSLSARPAPAGSSLYWYYALLALADFALNVAVVHRVAYTEIDWLAYMQEVTGVIEGGRLDYMTLKGDTGPLVYPGGFVYIYSLLYWVTSKGTDIYAAQCIFCVLHTATVCCLIYLYDKTNVVPKWAFVVLVLSRRIHSIFVLRLFNDCIAMLLAYLSFCFFLRHRWNLGSVLFSTAVSVKMNVLLFAPGLFFVLLNHLGPAGTAKSISICALVQLVAGVPFLYGNAWSYVLRAFDFGRVFMYKWSVNLQFLPEETFLRKEVAAALLACHLLVLALFVVRHRWYRAAPARAPAADQGSRALLLLFTANFVGVVFSRTLHYQFYVWYFHTLPFLLWSCRMHTALRLVILLAVEVVFNVYPPQAWASAVLWAAHLTLLATLYFAPTVRVAPQTLLKKTT